MGLTEDDQIAIGHEIARQITAALMPVRLTVDNLYEIVKRVTPEKKFQSVIDQLNAEMRERQLKQSQNDPRVDELQTRLNQLEQALLDLPSKIAAQLGKPAATPSAPSFLPNSADELPPDTGFDEGDES